MVKLGTRLERAGGARASPLHDSNPPEGRDAMEAIVVSLPARKFAMKQLLLGDLLCTHSRQLRGHAGDRLFADPVVRGAAVGAEVEVQVLGMGGVAAGAEDGEEIAAG